MLSRKQRRDLTRTVHLILGLLVALLVYAPTSVFDPLRLIWQAAIFPLLILSGLYMWLGPKFSARKTRPTSQKAPHTNGGK